MSQTLSRSLRLRFPWVAAFAVLVFLCLPAAAKTVVAGIAMDAAGKPIRGARVSVLSEDGSMVVGSDESDKKGRFKIELDVYGTHLLRIEADGFGPFEDTMNIQDGMETNAEIKLHDFETWQQQLAVEAFNRGVEALNAGDDDTAIASFEETAELNPALAQPYAALATIYHSQERWEKAVAAIEHFLELSADMTVLAPVAFDAYRKIGEKEKAQAALALVVDPQKRAGMAIGVFNDGAIAKKADEVDAAFELFVEAAVLDPTLAVAHEQLAAIEFDRKNYEISLTHLERLLALRPASSTGNRLRYYAFDQLGDPRAGEGLRGYLDVAPAGIAAVLLEEAAQFFEAGQNETAHRRLAALMVARPKLALAHYHMGRVLASSDAEEAKRHLQHFLELAPNDPEAETARAMLAGL